MIFFYELPSVILYDDKGIYRKNAVRQKHEV